MPSGPSRKSDGSRWPASVAAAALLPVVLLLLAPAPTASADGADGKAVKQFLRAFARAVNDGEDAEAAKLVRELAELDGEAAAKAIFGAAFGGPQRSYRILDD